MGADLEQGDYHAIPADPRDDESPVLGNAPSPTSGGKVDWDWRRETRDVIVMVITFVGFMVFMLWTLQLQYMPFLKTPAFSVGLAGYEGIDVARPGSVVSPAFNLTLRTNNPCADRAEVVLTYSGVPLGWARVEPRGCVSGEPGGRDVELVARADGVGLSRRLRERMASEWHRSGRLELDADVVFYDDRGPLGYPDYGTPDMVMRCKVVVAADGLQPELEPCPWDYLRPYNYDRTSILELIMN